MAHDPALLSAPGPQRTGPCPTYARRPSGTEPFTYLLGLPSRFLMTSDGWAEGRPSGWFPWRRGCRRRGTRHSSRYVRGRIHGHVHERDQRQNEPNKQTKKEEPLASFERDAKQAPAAKGLPKRAIGTVHMQSARACHWTCVTSCTRACEVPTRVIRRAAINLLQFHYITFNWWGSLCPCPTWPVGDWWPEGQCLSSLV